MNIANAGAGSGAAVTLKIEHIFNETGILESEQLQKNILDARQNIRKLRSRLKRLTPGSDLFRFHANNIRKLDRLIEKYENAYTLFRQWLTNPKVFYIDIRGRAFPGTTIVFEDRTLKLPGMLEGQRFFYTHGGVDHRPISEFK